MLSKAQAKRIRALHRKKIREQEGIFLVEGGKVVQELLASDWRIDGLYATQEFYDAHRALVEERGVNPTLCTSEELTKISTLRSNNAALALVDIPPPTTPTLDAWTLVLDDINDPGNLGAMLRIADWYGVPEVVCSLQTVEWTNPKVIAASKGSFLRVKVHSTPLDAFFERTQGTLPVFGAYLDGESIHTLQNTPARGMLVMGNEAHGISPSLEPYITRRITIPSFGHAESLNVGVATAVILDNLRRG